MKRQRLKATVTAGQAVRPLGYSSGGFTVVFPKYKNKRASVVSYRRMS